MPPEPGYVKRLQDHYLTRLPMAERWSDPSFLYSWRHPIGYYQRERVRRAVIRLLNRHQVNLAASVLDVGCGTGDFLRFIAELRGAADTLFGVDLSHESLMRGRRINAAIHIFQGDARQLPFRAESFNIVSQSVTFSHLTDPADLHAAAAEIGRVCAPDGWLIWQDLLPQSSASQQGFGLEVVRKLLPGFRVIASETLFRNIRLPWVTISTAYAVPTRSLLLADLAERILPGSANNLLVLLQKHAD